MKFRKFIIIKAKKLVSLDKKRDWNITRLVTDLCVVTDFRSTYKGVLKRLVWFLGHIYHRLILVWVPLETKKKYNRQLTSYFKIFVKFYRVVAGRVQTCREWCNCQQQHWMIITLHSELIEVEILPLDTNKVDLIVFWIW